LVAQIVATALTAVIVMGSQPERKPAAEEQANHKNQCFAV
jgi:hypothetical protein